MFALYCELVRKLESGKIKLIKLKKYFCDFMKSFFNG